jgi:ABC-type lipoprotein release transport system permease subunit
LSTWLLCRLIAGVRIAGWIPIHIPLDFPTLALALGLMAAISLLTTSIPAYRAARVSIAQALRFAG